MKTNLLKRIITIAVAVTITFAIGAGGAFAQGSVPVPDNGTVKDGGLVWLKNANCFGAQTWSNAVSRAANLKSGTCGLTDGSKAGDWRLPTEKELRGRANLMQEFYNEQKTVSYWCSNTLTNYYSPYTHTNVSDVACTVFLGNGKVFYENRGGQFPVLPVRAAP